MRLSKEIKAAFFVLSTILLFIFGFNYLKGSSILDKQKTIYAVYDEVDGLLVGANVMINGLSIGNVTELDFLPNSTKILVTLKVKDKLNFSSKVNLSHHRRPFGHRLGPFGTSPDLPTSLELNSQMSADPSGSCERAIESTESVESSDSL